jgi:hypothetical protein
MVIRMRKKNDIGKIKGKSNSFMTISDKEFERALAKSWRAHPVVGITELYPCENRDCLLILS